MRFLLPPVLAALAASMLGASAVRAQTATDAMIGVGYVGNGPHMVLGGTVWGLIPGLDGWGLYVDAKMGASNRGNEEGFEPGIEDSEVDPGHLPIGTDTYWRGANAAVARVLTDELTVYVGGGWAEVTQYREYLDASEVLGRFGYYWVEDESDSGGGLNLMAGGFLRITSSIRLQFGGEMRPPGYTVGASIVFPGR